MSLRAVKGNSSYSCPLQKYILLYQSKGGKMHGKTFKGNTNMQLLNLIWQYEICYLLVTYDYHTSLLAARHTKVCLANVFKENTTFISVAE
jgi:hypothetical protein